MKKTTCFLLALLICGACVSSCASDGTEAKTSDSAVGTTAAAETADYGPKANIPDADYGGYEVNFLTLAPYTARNKLITEQSGEPLDDAAFRRNSIVSELLNVTFVSDEIEYTTIASTVQKCVAAGDTVYDYIVPHCFEGVPAMATQGLLYDFMDLPVVDYSKPWWNQSILEEFAIGDTTFYMSGDMMMTNQCIFSVIFNKNYLNDYQITEDLYQVVRDGKWTHDKLMSLAKDVGSDINGDGVMDENDRYGYLMNPDAAYYYVTAYGQAYTERDNDGFPRVAINTERMVKIVEQYYEMLHAKDTFAVSYSSVDYESDFYRILSSERVFLAEYDVGLIYPYLRTLDYEFGILPLPKLDEAQEDYQVLCGTGFFGIPSNIEDPECVGTITEALMYYSYKYLRPAFFNVILENKTVRDEDSYAMLEMMHDLKKFDFGFNFDPTNGSLYFMLQNITDKKNSKDFLSYYEKQEKKLIKGFEKLFEAFEN